MDEQIDASFVIDVQRRKIEELTWQNTVLAAQLEQARARQESASGGSIDPDSKKTQEASP